MHLIHVMEFGKMKKKARILLSYINYLYIYEAVDFNNYPKSYIVL